MGRGVASMSGEGGGGDGRVGKRVGVGVGVLCSGGRTPRTRLTRIETVGRSSEEDEEEDEASAVLSGGVACCTTSLIGGLAFGEMEGKVERFAEDERRGRSGSGAPAVLELRKSVVGDMVRVAIIREAAGREDNLLEKA